MTPDQTRLIQQSWNEVVPNAHAMARLFYDRLFEIDPSVAKLFMGSNMEHQQRKLIVALGTVVDRIGEFRSLMPTLQSLGKRYSRYGVTDQHYQSFGTALLRTLSQWLVPVFHAQTRTAWTIAYAIVSGVMRKAGSHQPVAA